ncbi:uncharacterized protein LOC119079121 [Bradysia coprophila]|uniref:uncharacterized protein LOC119079121 n=1 Tax=Bradysia coprophila TaxID=38358 RepID=UPI00187D72E3|nr:uncharacterized protein LOC119079121 [Bradysia coprophila]
MMEAEEAEPVELTSQIGQNLDGLGYINDDFDTSGHGLSNSHISQKFDGDVMVAEQAAPEELTSHIGQNWDGLGYINYDAGSPSNINRNVDGDVMIAEQAASGELTSQAGNNIGSNIDGDVMQAEEVELINNISWNVGGEVVQGTQSQLNSQLENLNTLGYTNCDIYTSINGIIQNIIDVDAVQAEQYVLTEPSVQYIVVYSHTLGKTC